MKQNVQRTLAIELQKLSVAFRKQQKAYLNKLRKSSAASSSFSLLDDAGPSGRAGDEDYDPGFSEIQVPPVLAACQPSACEGAAAACGQLRKLLCLCTAMVLNHGGEEERKCMV